MQQKHKLIILLIIINYNYFAQNNKLDSINLSNCNDKGAFNLYIKKFRGEFIGGVYRNRDLTQSFSPFNLTYNIYLPFEIALNYINNIAHDKLLKTNVVLFLHHTNYGNYAIGGGIRNSFLLVKKTYFNYQIGIAWCEVVNKKLNDGFVGMGAAFHHQISLSYFINKKTEISLNVLHLSNGNVFNSPDNIQDVIGIGITIHR
jgi:ABC-type uncharacterized transport system fused permease/ATPase subunit